MLQTADQQSEERAIRPPKALARTPCRRHSLESRCRSCIWRLWTAGSAFSPAAKSRIWNEGMIEPPKRQDDYPDDTIEPGFQAIKARRVPCPPATDWVSSPRFTVLLGFSL